MSKKFEKLIELIINEDEKAARKLFHEIVVEKSRKIYEALDDEMNDFDSIGGDESDDFVADVDSDDDDSEFADVEFGDEETDLDPAADADMGAEGLEDRVVDLEDALDELKAEFAQLMSDEGSDEDYADEESDDMDFDADADADADAGDEESDDMDFDADAGDEESDDMDFDADADAGDEESDDMDFDADADAGDEELDDEDDEIIREYIEKWRAVGNSEESGTNAKSIVAGKNDMGGTSKNLVQGGEEKGGKADSPKDLIGKVQNTAGGTKKLSNAPKAKTSDSESGVNTKSLFNGKK